MEMQRKAVLLARSDLTFRKIIRMLTTPKIIVFKSLQKKETSRRVKIFLKTIMVRSKKKSKRIAKISLNSWLLIFNKKVLILKKQKETSEAV